MRKNVVNKVRVMRVKDVRKIKIKRAYFKIWLPEQPSMIKAQAKY